ncbi:MAG: glutamate--tRNA ligase [Candidatus Gracilibacteria bacterium]|nr:glutamate--tRNA ligase [Candidatus Gracilibacteria bacterium]
MVVTRFAPSPTGYLHVGGLRTALYAYLFAKKAGGKLILRIEDTDQNRQVEGAEENLIKSLEWAGLSFDEGPHVGGDNGPYRQSDRTELYQKYSQELIDNGKAYKCFCSSERLEEVRQKQEASKLPTGYDGHCRGLTESEVQSKREEGLSHVVRLKVPKEELIVFEDIVRGKVKFASHLVDDQVLLKSDSFPTYHLANVVDDHLMGVTHVIRGEEWLPSTPKHILLYKAFGWEAPQFSHLPLILNEDRSKLSKRQGDVAVEDYMAKGYKKEELNNFIAFLGWNPGGTREIYSLEELVAEFDLNKVQKAGAVFNLEKLNWFREIWKQRQLKEYAEEKGLNIEAQQTKQGGFKLNVIGDEGRYIFAEKLHEIVAEHLDSKEERDELFLKRCLYAVKDKIVSEPQKVNEFISFYFDAPELNNDFFLSERMGVDLPMASKALAICIKELRGSENWDENHIKEVLITAIKESGLKNGQVLWPMRVALTHVEFSPGAFESAWVLGKEKTIARLEEAAAAIV